MRCFCMSEIDFLYIDIVVTSCFVIFVACVLSIFLYENYKENKRIEEMKKVRKELRKKRREEREKWQTRN